PGREAVIQKPQELINLTTEVLIGVFMPAQCSCCGHIRSWCTADTKVNPARRHGIEHAELLSNEQWRMVRQHDTACPETDIAGFANQASQHELRRRGRCAGHGVVFGHPETLVPQPVCDLS